jgi:outer membrane protein assembly factor BamB
LRMVSFLRCHPLLALVLLLSLLVAACVPFRLEASWPALSVIAETGNVLLTYNDRIVMIDPASGELVKLRNADGEVRVDEAGNPRTWQFTGTEGQARQFYSAPVQLNAETLLVATYNSERVYEVDLPTARINSSIQVTLPGQVIADLVLTDNLLYVGISERNLVALESPQLRQRWIFETGQGVWSEPTVVDDVLYFASLDHNLYALNAETGEELWRLDLQGAAPGTPLFHNDRLYIGSFARKIFAISTEGDILSEYETADWVWGEPVIEDGILYAADVSGVVYALDARAGNFRELWRSNVASKGIRARPVVTGDYVIVGSRDHRLYWLNRQTGQVIEDEPTVETVQNRRIRELAGEILSDMLLIEPGNGVNIEEPYLLVSSVANEELLVAFKVSNGERMWFYPSR